MSLSPEDMALETARVGIEAESFLVSNFGKYLVERAQLDIEQGKDELVDIDPVHINQYNETRLKILVARGIIEYIHEAVQSGMAALNDIEEMEALGDEDPR